MGEEGGGEARGEDLGAGFVLVGRGRVRGPF